MTRLITVNNTDPNDKLNSSLSVLSQSVLTLILLEGMLLYHMSEILWIVVSAITLTLLVELLALRSVMVSLAQLSSCVGVQTPNPSNPVLINEPHNSL